jgi:hypothetical protein
MKIRVRPPEVHLTLNGRNIPFVNHVKYLGVIFDKRITWTLHMEMIEAKAFRTFIRIYSLFKIEHLSYNIKVTLIKALIMSVMTYACPAWELAAAPTKHGFPHNWKFSKVHTGLRFAHGFQHSLCIRLYKKLCRQQAEVIQNYENEHVCSIGQGEARHRKYKRLKLGGSQAYDRSSG